MMAPFKFRPAPARPFFLAVRRTCCWFQIDGLRRAAEHIAVLHASLQQNARGVSGHDHDDFDERSASGGESSSSTLGVMSGDAGKSSCSRKVLSQKESGDGGVVYVEDGTDAAYGPSSPGKGELGGRERDTNDRLLSMTEKPTCPAKNDTRGIRDGQVMTTIASDLGEPNSNVVLPSAERDQKDLADDGVGGLGTTTLAALGVIDNSRQRAEFSLNGDVAATGGHSMTEAPLRRKLKGSHNLRASASPGKKPPDMSPVSSGAINIGDDGEQDSRDRATAVGTVSDEAMGADDFLPLFALVLVSCAGALVLFTKTACIEARPYLTPIENTLVPWAYIVWISCCSVPFKRFSFLTLAAKVSAFSPRIMGTVSDINLGKCSLAITWFRWLSLLQHARC